MKRGIQALVGLVLGIVLVWLVFRGTDWAKVGDAIRTMDMRWFLVSLVPLWLSFFFRVQRWTYIVRASQPVSYRHLFAATQIGFLANFTLPGRVGDLLRGLVLTRLTGIPLSKTIAMVALDRATDLFGLIIVILVSIVAFRPPDGVSIPAETFGTEAPISFSAGQFQAGAAAVGVLMIAVIGALVILYLNRALMLRISDAIVGRISRGLAGRLRAMIEHFADGLHIFRSPADMARALGWSVLTWGCSIAVLIVLFKAFHIDAPWYASFVMLSLLSVFIAAPGTPGLVGQYHVPLVLGLAMLVPATNVDHARAFAIVAHLNNLPPIILMAAYALATEHLGILQLGREGLKADPGPR